MIQPVNKAEAAKSWAAGAAAGLGQGSALVPYPLLRCYRKLGLTDSECMLIVHLLAFQQVEHKGFPSLEELQERTGAPIESIAMSLQRLMKEGFIGIDEHVDPERGIQFERYNLSGIYVKIAELMEEDKHMFEPPGTAVQSSEEETAGSRGAQKARPEPLTEDRNLFTIFEKEFGRPLSPMELETISGWVDQDRYPDELILLALKEAVFAGKVHFRYIDRILLEWSRNRVRTVQDAKAYTQKFRSMGR